MPPQRADNDNQWIDIALAVLALSVLLGVWLLIPWYNRTTYEAAKRGVVLERPFVIPCADCPHDPALWPMPPSQPE